ncbi:MAG TPA: cyclic nucleotide-binding domain-containing protein [Chroococcidiopsis sp.]
MKKALYILAEMSDRDFDWLLQVGRSKAISTGTVLIHEGEPIDALYIILEGSFKVSVEALNTGAIAHLDDGEVVGEISFVDSRPPSATVTAEQDAIVWAIPRSQLAAKLSQDITFSSHFYKALAVFLSDRLRKTVSQLGYEKNPEYVPLTSSTDEGFNPDLFGNIELAKARLDWMLNRLKGVH